MRLGQFFCSILHKERKSDSDSGNNDSPYIEPPPSAMQKSLDDFEDFFGDVSFGASPTALCVSTLAHSRSLTISQLIEIKLLHFF